MIEVSLLIPARNAAHSLERTVEEAHRFLTQAYPGSFEIVLIPNPDPAKGAKEDGTDAIAQALCKRLPEVKSVLYTAKEGTLGPGKGAALQAGFKVSSGRTVFFTDADLPYDFEFFTRATEKLKLGFHLVTGNRRFQVSQFLIPVELLAVAYKRHRLGILFNTIVRRLFPLTSSDTQAGIKAMSREMASLGFEKMICPGFFFDIEFFLTSYFHSLPQIDLPVLLRLSTEKSTVRVVKESFRATYWLARIWFASLQGHYKPAPSSPYAANQQSPSLLKRYFSQPLSVGTKLFLYLRWHLTPYSRMAAHLPYEGNILDLGCGHGLLTLALALAGPRRKILGVDHDEKRIALAKKAAQHLSQITFQRGGFDSLPALPTYTGMTLIDVLHYFSPAEQQRWIQMALAALHPGGVLLIREVEPAQGLISQFNQFYEEIATLSGFTRSERLDLHFRTTLDWETLLRLNGFRVRSESCSSILFSDILYIAEKPA